MRKNQDQQLCYGKVYVENWETSKPLFGLGFLINSTTTLRNYEFRVSDTSGAIISPLLRSYHL